MIDILRFIDNHIESLIGIGCILLILAGAVAGIISNVQHNYRRIEFTRECVKEQPIEVCERIWDR